MLQLKIVLYPDFMLVLFLLIPDNVGAFKNEADRQLNHRAHQNIIFELGYFIGKLNPSQVCLLYTEDVELPSGIRDVAYVPMDSADAWKLKLRQGMRKAGLSVDMSWAQNRNKCMGKSRARSRFC